MAITIDWPTKVISVPQADLTFVTGTLYELDTDWFRLQLKALEYSEAGMAFEDTHVHNTEVTVAGTTFFRTVEVINGYSVQFTPDAQWSVRLIGSNNNIFDIENGILVQNQVQVIPTNSAGNIVVETGTSGLTPGESQQLSDIDTTTQSMDTTLTSVDGRVASLETLVSSLDTNIQTLDSQIQDLDSSVGVLNTTTAALNITVDTLRKLMQNRMETDPNTGILTIYDDDDTTPLFTANIYEDVLAAQLYRGRGIERRNRLT